MIFAVLQWKAQQVSYFSIATTENISYTRVQLYHDGSLRHYAWNQSRKKWDQQWSSFLEECDLYRRCTPNAYCHPGVSSSVCECIPGFEYSAINVISEECVRKKHGACNGDHFSLLPKMNFPDAYNARSYPAINKRNNAVAFALGIAVVLRIL
ncbi:S-locus-specific glycoprotein S6-like [Brassica napus]|uniref:S-locus-specific glycoprotein S6-like n=1 Tax=Brassica napus TaxID=3708 RepID=UPI002079D51C|nr:S-locus-specific glycoprotein S6-like [Brassica napus]